MSSGVKNMLFIFGVAIMASVLALSFNYMDVVKDVVITSYRAITR
ncbi:hypothetical protein [Terribacillus saccharophilus]|nr:hypothetical protein [Terribacillus goriensis]